MQNNDPAVTEVQRSLYNFPYRFTNAHARRLGDSLSGNPHVTLLKLDLRCLEDEVGPDEPNDSVSPLLRFLRESQALRKVCLVDCRESGSVSILRRFLLAISESLVIAELTLFQINVHPDGFDTL